MKKQYTFMIQSVMSFSNEPFLNVLYLDFLNNYNSPSSLILKNNLATPSQKMLPLLWLQNSHPTYAY